MIKFFKDGDSMALMTDASDEKEFVYEFIDALSEMIDIGKYQHDWEFQLSYWLPQFVDVCCKYRGYKNNVTEKKVLFAGTAGYPSLPTVCSRQNGKVIILEDYLDECIEKGKKVLSEYGPEGIIKLAESIKQNATDNLNAPSSNETFSSE